MTCDPPCPTRCSPTTTSCRTRTSRWTSPTRSSHRSITTLRSPSPIPRNYVSYHLYTGLEINISRQWTIGPPALEIWWSCQVSQSGGPDVANSTFFGQDQTQLTEFTCSRTKLLKIPCHTYYILLKRI